MPVDIGRRSDINYCLAMVTMEQAILFSFLILLLALILLVDWRHIYRALGGKQSEQRLARASKSPNFKDGKFVNLVPTKLMQPGSLIQTLRLQFFGTETRVPDQDLPTVPFEAKDFKQDANSLKAVWVGHASVLIQIDGSYVLTDPIWSMRASPSQVFGPKRFLQTPFDLKELPELSAVLISHDHYDHLDMDTIDYLKNTKVKFIVGLGVGAHLESWGVAPASIVELDWNQSVEIDRLLITLTPARHYSSRGLNDRDTTLWASFAVRAAQHSFYFSGDSGYFDGFKKIGELYGPFDLTLMKIGACGPTWPDVHMSPAEAVKAHRDLRGKVLLPIHWGTFNLAFHDWNYPAKELMAAVRDNSVRATMPKAGQIIDVSAPPFLDEWW